MAVGDFLAMGGYAAYVWSAFGFAAVVLIGLFVQSWLAVRRGEAELAALRGTVRAPARGPARPTVIRADAPDAAAPAFSEAAGLGGQPR